MLRVERAPSNRSMCVNCKSNIPLGSVRLSYQTNGQSGKLCFNCFQRELNLLGFSVVPITDKDLSTIISDRIKGEIDPEDIKFDVENVYDTHV